MRAAGPSNWVHWIAYMAGSGEGDSAEDFFQVRNTLLSTSIPSLVVRVRAGVEELCSQLQHSLLLEGEWVYLRVRYRAGGGGS